MELGIVVETSAVVVVVAEVDVDEGDDDEYKSDGADGVVVVRSAGISVGKLSLP